MIKLYPYQDLGGANHGWLNAKHHFSFASYYDSRRMNFGVLRVINDDVISPKSGFPNHPHRDMEIITYVRSGAVTHKDNNGNEGRTVAGDVQVMSAGTGILHSEFNLENEDTTLYQIWISPKEKNVKPRWDSKSFPKNLVSNKLSLLVSGDKNAPLFIHQDAQIYGGNLKKGTNIKHQIKNQIYILASDGEFMVDAVKMTKGDGAEITHLSEININAIIDCEILVIDVPNHN